MNPARFDNPFFVAIWLKPRLWLNIAPSPFTGIDPVAGINPEPVRGAAMAANARAAWNDNDNQWQGGDSQWQRDDSQWQWRETMLQMATLNTLLVGIGAEQKKLNRQVQKIEEELVEYKRNVSAGFSAVGPSFSRPAPPPAPLVSGNPMASTSFSQPPPPAAAPPGRRSRPRSGSWPLSPSSGTDCGWHGDAADTFRIDDATNEVIRSHEYLVNSSNWSHLDAIFYSDLGFTKAMFDSLVEHMRYHRVELWHAPTTGSRNTRRFVIQCRHCSRGCGMVYAPHDLKDEAQLKEQKCAILRFLKVPMPGGVEPVV